MSSRIDLLAAMFNRSIEAYFVIIPACSSASLQHWTHPSWTICPCDASHLLDSLYSLSSCLPPSFFTSSAISIDSIPAGSGHGSEPATVIAIDGTWAQARSLLSGNEFLQKLKKVDWGWHLCTNGITRYTRYICTLWKLNSVQAILWIPLSRFCAWTAFTFIYNAGICVLCTLLTVVMLLLLMWYTVVTLVYLDCQFHSFTV